MADDKDLVDPKTLDQLTDGFVGFLDAVVQPVDNAIDAGASKIILRFFTNKDEKPCLAIIDDGTGMDDKGRNAYTSLCRSTSRDKEGKKGRNGSGRLGFFRHAASCYTVERALGEDAYEITLTRDTFFKSIFIDRKRIPWTKHRVTKASLVGEHGTAVIWQDLTIGSRQQQAQRKPEMVIEGLAQKLAPSVARLVEVQVVDQTGVLKSFPLKKREIKGKPIEGERHNVESLGSIYWNLYVVAKHDRSIDHVMLGARGPVCTWLDAAKMLMDDKRYEALAREINPVLYHPQVVGNIDVPYMNRFAVGDRKSFSAAMLDDEVFCDAFLQFLRTEIQPLVEAELGMRGDELVTTDDATFVATLCRDIQDATGVIPVKKTVAEIEVNRQRVDLVPGQTYVFEINDPKPGKRYVWDDTNSGGTLNAKTGPRVEYTAHKLGQGFKLLVRAVSEVTDKLEKIITINVYEKLPLRFTQSTIHMGVHDTHMVRLENVQDGTKLHWSEQSWNGRLEVNPDASGATVVSGRTQGVYEIRVVDESEHDPTPAICEVHIEKEKEKTEKPKTRDTRDTEFMIDGHRFRLLSNQFKGPTAERMTSWSERDNDAGDYHVITLNLGHPVFANLTDVGKRAVALREIAIRAAQHLLPEIATQEDMLEKAAAIGTVFAAKYH